MSDRICQDEPGYESARLSRWFASRIDARWVVRRFWPRPTA